MTAQCLPAGPEAYARAAVILSSGGLVALPTETVYGLAGDARSDAAIKAIYAAKGRPSHNPLITHLQVPEQARTYSHINSLAQSLIDEFWPGPLTLVLPRRDNNLALRATAGLSTIALRCPDAEWVEGLYMAGWSAPLVMPSANRSGHVSPTDAAHVMADLADHIDLVIDGGSCRAGLESTVLAFDAGQAVLLREGALPRERLEKIAGPLRSAKPDQPVASPGMLARHYAPEAALRLNAHTAASDEIMIGFGPTYPPPNLSSTADLNEAARNLYRLLRAHDAPGHKMAVAPIPETGLGRAINDRLRRAALGR